MCVPTLARAVSCVWGPLDLLAEQTQHSNLPRKNWAPFKQEGCGILVAVVDNFGLVKQKGTGVHMPSAAQIPPRLCSQWRYYVRSKPACTAVVLSSASSASCFSRSQTHPASYDSCCHLSARYRCLLLCFCPQLCSLVTLLHLLKLCVLLTFSKKCQLLSYIHQ